MYYLVTVTRRDHGGYRTDQFEVGALDRVVADGSGIIPKVIILNNDGVEVALFMGSEVQVVAFLCRSRLD